MSKRLINKILKDIRNRIIGEIEERVIVLEQIQDYIDPNIINPYRPRILGNIIIPHGSIIFPSIEFNEWRPQRPDYVSSNDMIILIVKYRIFIGDELGDIDYSSKGVMRTINDIPELQGFNEYNKKNKSPYTTATFHLRFNQIKDILHEFFSILYAMSYVHHIEITFPMNIELLYEPLPRIKRPLYNQHFNYENLIDYSVHPFLCVPDLLFHEFSKNVDGSIHTVTKGRYPKALTLDHILSSITKKPTTLNDINPRELICTIETIKELADIYKPAYIRIYDITHYNQIQDYNHKPLYERVYTHKQIQEYNNKPTYERVYTHNHNHSNIIQGVTIFVIDDHVYSHPIKNKGRGHSPTDICNRPGIPKPDYKNYSIVSSLDNLPPTPVIFITTNQIHEKVIQDLKSNNIPQIIRHDNETSQITRIYTGRQTIIYAPDAESSTNILFDFNSRYKKEIEYFGQNHSSIAESMLKSLNLLPASHMSQNTYCAFTSNLIEIYSPKGVVYPITNDAIYLDVVRHYFSTLKHIDLPIYSISDDPEQYNGDPINDYSFYLVLNVPNFKDSLGLCNGDGYYYGQLVQEMLSRNYKIEIKEKLTPLNHKKLAGIEEIISLFPKQKMVFNALWGRTKTSKTYSGDRTFYCTTWEEVMTLKTNESRISYIDFSDELPIQKEFTRISDYSRNILYMVSNSKQSPQYSNNLPFHYCVVQMANLLLSRHIVNTVNNPIKNVLAYSTDSVAIASDSLLIAVKDKKDCQNGEFGRYNGSFKFNCPLLIRPKFQDYEYPIARTTKLTTGVQEGSFIVYGKPGTGKSYTLAQNIKARKEKEKLLIMTPTNAAKESLMRELYKAGITDLQVHTLSAALGYDNKGRKNPDGKSLLIYHHDTIIVDEVFMVKQQMMLDIYKYVTAKENRSVILAGDPNQIEAIDEECQRFTLSIFGSFVGNLVNGNYMELTKNYRAITDPNFAVYKQQMDLAEAGLPIDKSLFGNQPTKINLCYHVRKKNELNIKISHEECQRLNAKNYPLPDVEYALFIGMPVITTTNKEKYKNGQKWIVYDISDKQITLVREFLGKSEVIELTINEFIKNIDPAYAQTVHSAQGSTIDEPMTIHEWNCRRCTKGWRNVALSRATKMEYVNFADEYLPNCGEDDTYFTEIIDPDDRDI